VDRRCIPPPRRCRARTHRPPAQPPGPPLSCQCCPARERSRHRWRTRPGAPLTTGTPPASSVALIRSGCTSTMLALVCRESVTIPACAPVKLSPGISRSWSARHSSADLALAGGDQLVDLASRSHARNRGREVEQFVGLIADGRDGHHHSCLVSELPT
jgi:hypothetical protein